MGVANLYTQEQVVGSRNQKREAFRDVKIYALSFLSEK